MFRNLFYDSWKISDWSDPAPVVDGQTHTLGTSYRNGFPMNLAMGGNGKLHLVLWKVSTFDWVYTTLEPAATRFEQSFSIVNHLPDNPGGIDLMPAIDLISDDVPYIVYSYGSGSSYTLAYQQYDNVSSTWGSEVQLLTGNSDKITKTFLAFLTSDFKPHIFYVTDETPNRMYHTTKVSVSPFIEPDPPELFLSDVGPVCALRQGGDNVIFVYSDTARQNLYFRRYTDSNVTTIWSVPDSSYSIGEIAVAFDSKDNIHVCFGTYKTSEPLNTAYGAIRYVTNAGGSWTERESITGTSTSGPLAVFFPAAVFISQDTYGNDRVHLAYTVYKPPGNFFFWYAYWDEAGWQPMSESLDTVNTNSFWTFPLIKVDPAGTVHVVYSWAESELDRTSMYIRGTPAESQR